MAVAHRRGVARPNTKPGTQFNVTWPLYREHQRRWEIDKILRLHDAGYFRDSAGLVDEMMTDDRIAGVTDSRASALLSKPFTFKASGKTAKHDELATYLGGDGEDVEGAWNEMAPKAAIRQIMAWGWHVGVGVAEIVWENVEDASGRLRWMPRLVPYHPSFVRWDMSVRRFILQTEDDGRIVLPRPDEQPNGDGRWLIYCPWGVVNGWRRALVRSLAAKYIQRKWNERDWARYCEKNGLAIVVAKVPMATGGNSEDRERFFDTVNNLGSEATVFAPQGGAGEASYDVDLKEPSAQTWQAFKAWKEALDADIAIRIVGQPGTTNSQGAGLGNTGNKVQQEVAEDIMRDDADFAKVLHKQLFSWYVDFNEGDRALTPFCQFETDPPEDAKSTGDAQTASGAAVSAWKLAGAAVDVNAMAEKAGVILLPVSQRPKPGEGGPEGEDAPGDGAGGGGTEDDPSGKGAGDDAAAAGDEKDDQPKARTQLRAHPMVVRNRYDFQGLPIAVENTAGSMRTWLGPDGKTGQTKMLHDYGYIEGWLGEDGEDLDCYIGPDADADLVHIVHQLAAPDFKRHDEMKVFLGFPDAAAALDAFHAHRNDMGAFGGMTTFTMDRFKAKLSRRKSTSTTRIRAREDFSGAAALRAPKAAAGKDSAALYIDQLVVAAKRQGVADLRPFLEEVKKATAEGKDWDDIRARCLAALKAAKPSTSMAQTVAHARIMARLMGRGAILDSHGRGAA